VTLRFLPYVPLGLSFRSSRSIDGTPQGPRRLRHWHWYTNVKCVSYTYNLQISHIPQLFAHFSRVWLASYPRVSRISFSAFPESATTPSLPIARSRRHGKARRANRGLLMCSTMCLSRRCASSSGLCRRQRDHCNRVLCASGRTSGLTRAPCDRVARVEF